MQSLCTSPVIGGLRMVLSFVPNDAVQALLTMIDLRCASGGFKESDIAMMCSLTAKVNAMPVISQFPQLKSVLELTQKITASCCAGVTTGGGSPSSWVTSPGIGGAPSNQPQGGNGGGALSGTNLDEMAVAGAGMYFGGPVGAAAASAGYEVVKDWFGL